MQKGYCQPLNQKISQVNIVGVFVDLIMYGE